MSQQRPHHATQATTSIISVVLTQLLLACGTGNYLATSADVEKNLASYLRRESSRPVESVDCPDGRRLRDGDRIDCFAVMHGGTSVPLTITVQGREGQVTYYPDLRR